MNVLACQISILENMIKLTLANNTSDKDIYFDLFDTNIARKWDIEVKKNYPIFEDDRFTGWPNTIRTKKWYVDELNKSIDIVNSHCPGTIKHRAIEDMVPEHTNILHKYFEDLRGGYLSTAKFYIDSPESVKKAIEHFNIMIHAYEKVAYSPLKSPTITCTFTGTRHELSDEDYDYFTYNWQFGTIYINYCEVGKHLLDVFIDNDSIVGDENIRPLKYYSTDFKLKFSPSLPIEKFQEFSNKFESWFDENSEYFKELSIHKDKYRSLGLIPVASINRELSGFLSYSEQDIINELSVYNKVIGIKSI